MAGLPALEWLDVSANQATAGGAVGVALAAARAAGLTHLGLDENELSQAAIDKVKVSWLWWHCPKGGLLGGSCICGGKDPGMTAMFRLGGRGI